MPRYKNKKRETRGRPESTSRQPSGRPQYTDRSHQNAAFEEYYKAQGLVPADEWDRFINALRTSLPSTFRFIDRPEAKDSREWMIREYFDIFKQAAIDEQAVVDNDATEAADSSTTNGDTPEHFMPPTPIPWYPKNLAWRMEIPRRVLRKHDSLEKFHKWLVSENEMGTVYRQEEVSMIPVMFLDVQPHHHVLDMCAAPGSKTCQMLEILNANDDLNSDGLLIANDANYERSHMLIHQMKRLPTPGLIVTNHEAQFFPILKLPVCSASSSDGMNAESKEKWEPLLFDRILADVPCSGDGTIRKNVNIWATWNTAEGRGLHNLQLNILDRACELLKVGGRLVYSTCSLNPLENEAVVAAMLSRAPHAFEVMDVSDHVPGLKRREGLSHWKVPGDPASSPPEYIEKYEDAQHSKFKWTRSMFPPENVKELHLERSMRLLPHYQNTGGFFVSVIQKKAPYHGYSSLRAPDHTMAKKREPQDDRVSAADEKRQKAEPNAVEPGANTDASASSPLPNADHDAVQGRAANASHEINTGKLRGEPRFYSYTPACTDLQSIIEWYNLPPSFPIDRVLGRAAAHPKTFWIASRGAHRVLRARNISCLKVLYAGLKSFIKNAGAGLPPCTYRIDHVAVPLVRACARTLRISFDDLVTALGTDYPKFASFGVATPLALSTVGPYVMEFDPADDQSGRAKERLVNHTLYIPFWRAQTSISIFLDKNERRTLYARLTGLEYVPQALPLKAKSGVADVDARVQAE
ncbi:hypothetical protein SeLEV6574_g03949 [Synchytrium endobioticum]|uniref:SAM-dependent MTase RsmB/NOP-type domain-containing protein n=1 Tax=Synchytrium endobioticum TaxID=286115 RepID=A0A507D1W7_9FUNG|nr:hypothetical protein SeLEV6574_g03949 [Synchytrium endobioticum]